MSSHWLCGCFQSTTRVILDSTDFSLYCLTLCFYMCDSFSSILYGTRILWRPTARREWKITADSNTSMFTQKCFLFRLHQESINPEYSFNLSFWSSLFHYWMSQSWQMWTWAPNCPWLEVSANHSWTIRACGSSWRLYTLAVSLSPWKPP